MTVDVLIFAPLDFTRMAMTGSMNCYRCHRWMGPEGGRLVVEAGYRSNFIVSTWDGKNQFTRIKKNNLDQHQASEFSISILMHVSLFPVTETLLATSKRDISALLGLHPASEGWRLGCHCAGLDLWSVFVHVSQILLYIIVIYSQSDSKP